MKKVWNKLEINGIDITLTMSGTAGYDTEDNILTNSYLGQGGWYETDPEACIKHVKEQGYGTITVIKVNS